MKTTYLIYKQINGLRQLAVASQQEWDVVLKENRQLPPAQRRRFMKDCIADGAELDCMYIEVSAEEHRQWNSKNTVCQRSRQAGKSFVVQSLDANDPDNEMEPLYRSIPSNFDLEQMMGDKVLFDQLRKALREWKPWGEELLDLYMAGKKRSCSLTFCEKYHIKERTARKCKESFEKFILDFSKK